MREVFWCLNKRVYNFKVVVFDRDRTHRLKERGNKTKWVSFINCLWLYIQIFCFHKHQRAHKTFRGFFFFTLSKKGLLGISQSIFKKNTNLVCQPQCLQTQHWNMKCCVIRINVARQFVYIQYILSSHMVWDFGYCYIVICVFVSFPSF